MIEVNLHPRREPRSGRWSGLSLPAVGRTGGWRELVHDPWHAAFVAAAVLVPLAIGGMWLQIRAERGAALDRLAVLEQDSGRLATRGTLTDSVEAVHEEVRGRIAALRALDTHRYAWPKLMDLVARALPRGAWLTAIETRSPLPDLAVAVEGRAPSPLAVTRYVRALEASPLVERVRLEGTSRVEHEGGRVQRFAIVVHYRGSPAGQRETQPVAKGG